MKILMVDDEIECIESLEIALKPLKHEITLLTDPLKALDLLKEEKFNVVITDVRMPGMSGIELLKEINRHHFKIRTIVMTAYGDLPTAIECINHHAYAFFPKPVNVKEFIGTINQIEVELKNKKPGVNSKKLYEVHNQLKEAYENLLGVLKKTYREAENDYRRD